MEGLVYKFFQMDFPTKLKIQRHSTPGYPL